MSSPSPGRLLSRLTTADAEGGPLVVTSAGGVLVTTDALLAHLPTLDAFADATDADGRRAALLALRCPTGPIRSELERCERRAAELADELRRLRGGLLHAATGYTAAERAAAGAHDAVAAAIAGILPRLLAPFLPQLAAAGALAWHLAPGSDEQKAAALQRYLLEHPELITNPEFCALVRHVVTGVDDAALATLGVPPPIAFALGDQGLGLLGVDTSAGALIALGALSGTRYFHETPVRVEQAAPPVTGGSAPRTASERLDRVPHENQVTIERYDAPGREPRYLVYVAPTQTFSPVAADEPWDLTSNVAAVAGLPAGSVRATELAMADAGITDDSEVVLVGFSQGGLVADAIVSSERWNVVGLETYGDPGGGIELPEGVRGVAVRHTDDFVVATGGPQQSTDRVIVERQAYLPGEAMPTDRPAPAHQKDAYARTAALLDAAKSSTVRAELDALRNFTDDYIAVDGSTMTSYSYRAERVSPTSG